ncbi:MAG TPA: prepilin-type N-terminal cleavage/methylation domain-containing protein [Candidatus Saccharimonadales bacterium]|nr:prepilin-type N-terminal cleavage/methylation domain-containing protein [Candidatus Saccharimonadales bacterium]
MWAKQKQQKGFTIVELLIVIVVISILAAITIVAYNGVQARARASAIVSDLQNVDKAFHLLAVEQGRSTWWLDTDLTGAPNPDISALITSTNLKNYLQGLSEVSGTGDRWAYDNDGDIYDGCSIGSGGANIYIYTISQELTQSVDNTIDDGNLSCGVVTYNNNNLRYSLSSDQAIN